MVVVIPLLEMKFLKSVQVKQCDHVSDSCNYAEIISYFNSFVNFYNANTSEILNNETFWFQGEGDESCHFIVHNFKDKGYIALESATLRGMYVGMTSEGKVRPTVDVGEKNVRFYPEVVECKFGFECLL
jgi:hypothetical protein